MKKAICVILAVFMCGSCFAVSASAESRTSTTIVFAEGESSAGEWWASMPPNTSGKYRVKISSTGTFAVLSYKVVNAAGEELASYESFPQSAHYAFAAGEEYFPVLRISGDTGEAVTITFVVDSLMQTGGTEFPLSCIGY